jgi:RND family efflux transporter MFP subunit
MQIQPDKQQAALSSAVSDVRAQNARVQLAEKDLHRYEALYEAKVVSRQALDDARMNYDAAVAQLKSLQAQVRQQGVQLQYYQVRALRPGVVGDIPVRVGDRVTNTTVLTTLIAPGGMEAYIYVPVEQSPRLKRGLPIDLLDDSGAPAVHSAINFVAPRVDATTQTVLAKAPIPDETNLRTDQFVRAHVIWGTHQAVLIPVLAVARINGRTFAFVAEKQGTGFVARQKPIETGRISGNDYEVTSGLQPGEQVIVGSLQFLADGMPVVPMPAHGSGAAH